MRASRLVSESPYAGAWLLLFVATVFFHAIGLTPPMASEYYDKTDLMIKECKEIAMGATKPEVEEKLRNHIDSKQVTVSRTGPGFHPLWDGFVYDSALWLYALAPWDDIQCVVFFQSNLVIFVETIED